MSYPPPSENEKCECWPNLMAAMLCPFGHMLECHYPMTCEEAECDHYQAAIEQETEDLSEEQSDY